MPKTTSAKRSKSTGIPKPSPVRMPAGYVPKGTKPKFLPWTWVTQRLESSHNYWICTTRADGRPHAVPVWGVFVDGLLVFSTDPASVKARNMQRNPEIAVHLESGDEVVIVNGTVERIALTQSIDDAYNRKYKMRLSEFPGPSSIYAVKPKVVLAWTEKEFVTNGTRWEFD
jgi:pyridoxine/pyridoxamine 5'-phosphate oxidase